MQTNLLWTGREYYSLENCFVKTTKKGTEINSIIIGKYNSKIYRVEYEIKTNKKWETVFVEVKSINGNKVKHLRFENDGKGNWYENGKQADLFKGCVDIDIALTPFTNTLPINRLALSPGMEQQIQVIYFDVLKHRVKRVPQKYIRLSDTEYRYENVPNDFEAKIKVDEHGFVVDYPPLFERIAIVYSDYI